MDTARYVGVGIVSLMHTIDPGGVLLGRGDDVWRARERAGPAVFGARTRRSEAAVLPVPAAKTAIDFASLGADAGYIGAAGMARAEYRRK